MQRPYLLSFALVSLVLNGAVFGFFYAWVCSTMWGLDAADPRTAIAAMQAMNASVRNLVFAPTFFATPFVLALTAVLAFRRNIRDAALLFGAASLTYLFGGLLLTALVNVPMNEALALVTIPDDIEAARRIWLDYSSDWQVWNQIRTVFSGLALCCTGLAIYRLGASRGAI